MDGPNTKKLSRPSSNKFGTEKSSAPYLDIQPRDLTIQMFGDVAIATFHLDDRPGFLNRRTLVLHKTNSGWKIVHLHASEVSLTR